MPGKKASMLDREEYVVGSIVKKLAKPLANLFEDSSEKAIENKMKAVHKAVEEAPAETLAAPATTSPPPEKLLIWAEEKIAVALDPLVGAYEAAAGVDVEVAIYDFGAIKEDVSTAGPAGEGPDLFIGPHDMVGEVVTNGLVSPIDLGSIQSDIFDVGISAFSFGGEVYGFPYATEAIAMYYNADLVDGVPTTWDEVKAVETYTNAFINSHYDAKDDLYKTIDFDSINLDGCSNAVI